MSIQGNQLRARTGRVTTETIVCSTFVPNAAMTEEPAKKGSGQSTKTTWGKKTNMNASVQVSISRAFFVTKSFGCKIKYLLLYDNASKYKLNT